MSGVTGLFAQDPTLKRYGTNEAQRSLGSIERLIKQNVNVMVGFFHAEQAAVLLNTIVQPLTAVERECSQAPVLSAKLEYAPIVLL